MKKYVVGVDTFKAELLDTLIEHSLSEELDMSNDAIVGELDSYIDVLDLLNKHIQEV